MERGSGCSPQPFNNHAKYRANGVNKMSQPIALSMSKIELIEAHKVLEEYHRYKSKKAILDIIHDWHENLANLLHDEITSLELQEEKDV